MPPTLWINVEDLFEYAANNRRPSGIQRLAFEICHNMHGRLGDEGIVRFVRIDPVRETFFIVSWQSIDALFNHLTDDSTRDRVSVPLRVKSESMLRQTARRLIYRLPAHIRRRFLAACHNQADALLEFGGLIGDVGREAKAYVAKRISKSRRYGHTESTLTLSADGFQAVVQPGDILLEIGAGWIYPDHAKLIQRSQAEFGVKFGVLIYDIIPIRHPEWCDRNLANIFRSWFGSVLPLADFVFAISDHTATDVLKFATQRAIPLRCNPCAIPVGSGFRSGTPNLSPMVAHLPKAGTYVLSVSTIEARKNHILLFRVWQRLLEELPESAVPTLVFAGRVGWLVNDLMQQIKLSNYLNGKIIVLSDLSDAELRELYLGCLLTVFPSHYEGWGLPVSESLAFGKPCLASNKTSIPEAGGEFCRYFDPDNLNDAYKAIRDILEDPIGLSDWEAEVRRAFRPTSWEESATSILNGLGVATPRRSKPT